MTTGWPRVVEKGREVGLGFDWWQDALGRVILGKRSDGKYAATIGGVVLSIPRQVGKTYFVGAFLILMCLLFPGYKVIWTAHRTRTSTSAFRSMQRMVKRKKVWPHVLHIRTANGEQEIGFRNGSVIMFGAREQGFGRGFDEVDAEVFDEAQILTVKALEDMVAATNQSRHPHGALLFYMGTPPRPVDPGEAFTEKRAKAIAGKTKDMVYLECSADPGCDPDDRVQWAKANFSYPKRTPVESMLRLRENLPGDEAWMREGLGVWDDMDAVSIFGVGKWEACAREAMSGAPKALGLAVSRDRDWACIGAAAMDGETIQVKPLRHGAGTSWLLEAATEFAGDLPIIVDRGGPAGYLIPDLRAAGWNVVDIGLGEYADTCARFFDSVQTGEIAHDSNEALDAAVKRAIWREVLDRKVWGRKAGDITPLESTTLAVHGVIGVQSRHPIDNIW